MSDSLRPHGLLPARLLCPCQARILECVAISYSGDLPDPRTKSTFLASPALVGRFFTTESPGKTQFTLYRSANQKWASKLDNDEGQLIFTYRDGANFALLSLGHKKKIYNSCVATNIIMHQCHRVLILICTKSQNFQAERNFKHHLNVCEFFQYVHRCFHV